MLADEPVASVDPARAAALIQLLVRLAKEDELALVVSLHSEDLARQHFDRVIGLKGGRVVFDAAPDALDDDAFAALYAPERGRDPHPRASAQASIAGALGSVASARPRPGGCGEFFGAAWSPRCR